jgi:hypothetical protein
MFSKNIRISLLFLLISITVFKSYGIECRSMLAEYLKPIDEEFPLSWAFEATLAGGVMTDRQILNTMALAGLDFSFDNNKHQIYIEGGVKYWYNSNPGAGKDSGGQSQGYNKFLQNLKNKVMFREAYYKYNGTELGVTVGLQSAKLGDYMMLDERMVGLKGQFALDEFNIQASIGTVTADFARIANFCSTRHINNILHARRYDFWGTRFWETNFAGIVASYAPSSNPISTKKSENQPAIDSIMEDEFDYYSESEFQALNSNNKSSNKFLEQLGLLFYEEFGSGFHEYKYYTGIFSQINLPLNIALKSEIVNQYIPNERTWAYLFQAENTQVWGNGDQTSLRAGIIGKIDVDDSVHFYPAFTNFFLGEIIRLDAIHIPIAYASLKHYFAWDIRLSLKLQAIFQLEGDKSNEIDFEANLKLFRHIKLTGIFSRVQSNLLNEIYYMFRVEIRAGI